MPAIPFPISSAPGVKSQEGSGLLVNCFAEKVEQGGRFPVLWRRCAGLTQLVEIVGETHLRGALFIDDVMISVVNGEVYAVTELADVFTATDLGSLAGTDRVTIARNNNSTPDIVAVSTAGVYNLFTGTAPTAFADADLPAPNSVSVLNGYFLWTIGDGRIFASGLNSVSVATNSFTTAQRRPGGLLRGVAFRGQFFAFGPASIEVYEDKGASPFPLEFATMIPRGILATHAVAGWEEGWSNKLIWVADDSTVCQLNGYEATPISTPDVVRDIVSAVRADTARDLTAEVYMQGPHAMWRLTLPGFWTWEFNATTGNWHQRRSYNRDDLRVSATVKAHDRWITGDYDTGLLFEVDETAYKEGDDALPFVLRSGVGASFPNRIQIPRLDFDFTAGTGVADGEDPIETDPVVTIRWSKDGGGSFGDPVTRRLGAQGEYSNRVTVLRGPQAGPKGVVVELMVTDPVHVGFLGGVFEGIGLNP